MGCGGGGGQAAERLGLFPAAASQDEAAGLGQEAAPLVRREWRPRRRRGPGGRVVRASGASELQHEAAAAENGFEHFLKRVGVAWMGSRGGKKRPLDQIVRDWFSEGRGRPGGRRTFVKGRPCARSQCAATEASRRGPRPEFRGSGAGCASSPGPARASQQEAPGAAWDRLRGVQTRAGARSDPAAKRQPAARRPRLVCGCFCASAEDPSAPVQEAP